MILISLTYKIIAVIIGLTSLLFGIVALLRSESVIKFQQRYCERINWKVEPISWELEVRSTKRFGRILIFLGTVLLTIAFFAKV
ncbi:MAG: hypothetical protein ABH847_00790 [Candidatus Omnitrophota bacterium]